MPNWARPMRLACMVVRPCLRGPQERPSVGRELLPWKGRCAHELGLTAKSGSMPESLFLSRAQQGSVLGLLFDFARSLPCSMLAVVLMSCTWTAVSPARANFELGGEGGVH